MKYLVFSFVFVFILISNVVYAGQITYNVTNNCGVDGAFEIITANLTLDGNERYSPILVSDSINNIVIMELSVPGNKTKYKNNVKALFYVICNGQERGTNGIYATPKVQFYNNLNQTSFVWNITFKVPEDATYCEAHAKTYLYNETWVYQNNCSKKEDKCFCALNGPDVDHQHASKTYEVWTREQYFMDQWAEEFRNLASEERDSRDWGLILNFVAVFGGLILGGLITLYATNKANSKLFKQKMKRDDAERIYIPSQNAVESSLEQINNFKPIKSSHNDWQNICETSLSTIFENKNKKLYDSIKKYHNETIVEYNERLKNVIKMFKPTLEKELKPFGATRNMYENDTEEKLYYMLFTGNIPEKLILVGFTYDEHLDSTTLNAEDLKKIKSIFDKQEFVKEFKKYQRSLVRKTKKLIDDLKKNQDL